MKIPLLCQPCENAINRSEKIFNEKIFVPYSKLDGSRIRYNNWLLHFCVSLSWRILLYSARSKDFENISSDTIEVISEAEKVWREFLVGIRKNPGIFEQHIFVNGPILYSDAQNIPVNINRFMMRHVFFQFKVGNEYIFTIAKIGIISIIGLIRFPKNDWFGTKVHVNDGYFPSYKSKIPGIFGAILYEKAKESLFLRRNLSENQMAIIEKNREKIDCYPDALKAFEFDRVLHLKRR